MTNVEEWVIELNSLNDVQRRRIEKEVWDLAKFANEVNSRELGNLLLNLLNLHDIFHPVKHANSVVGVIIFNVLRKRERWDFENDDWGPLSDLTPLTGTPLNNLNLHTTLITDLTPIRDCPLTALNVADTPVSSIAVLEGIKLDAFLCERSSVADLSPLIEMPLSALDVSNTPVVDLSPIKKLPLRWLHCDFRPERDANIVRSIMSLVTINGKPVDDFWKGLDDRSGPK